MIITKKVQKEYFEAIMDGRKRFEVRLADFKAQLGDTLVLKEQDAKNILTGREITCEILYHFMENSVEGVTFHSNSPDRGLWTKYNLIILILCNTKDIEKFYSKKDIDKYGLAVLAVRKKYAHSEWSENHLNH